MAKITTTDSREPHVPLEQCSQAAHPPLSTDIQLTALAQLQEALSVEANRFKQYSQDEEYDARAELVSKSIEANSPYEFTVHSSIDSLRSGSAIQATFTTREAGLKQIAALTSELEREHTWVYVPKLELWLDDTTESSTHSTNGDFLLRTHLGIQYQNVELFHTHPEHVYTKAAKEHSLDMRYVRLSAIPTVQDIITLGHVKMCAHEPERFVGHVISTFGVTSYERTHHDVPEGWLRSEPVCEERVEELIMEGNDDVEQIQVALEDLRQQFHAGDNIRWKRVPIQEFHFKPYDSDVL